MGQVNLVLIGQHFINPGDCFTLTSCIFAEETNYHKSALGMVNGAFNGFVINAVLEMLNKVGINVISPSILLEASQNKGNAPAVRPSKRRM